MLCKPFPDEARVTKGSRLEERVSSVEREEEREVDRKVMGPVWEAVAVKTSRKGKDEPLIDAGIKRLLLTSPQ
jgi:hypothetical protein